MAVSSDRASGSDTNFIRGRHVVVVHDVAILLLQKKKKTRIPLRFKVLTRHNPLCCMNYRWGQCSQGGEGPCTGLSPRPCVRGLPTKIKRSSNFPTHRMTEVVDSATGRRTPRPTLATHTLSHCGSDEPIAVRTPTVIVVPQSVTGNW